jgi:hypothetical protein
MNTIARNNAVMAYSPLADQTGKEGYFVKLDTSGYATVVSATTDVPFGVIVDGAALLGKSGIAVGSGGFRGTVRVKLDASPGTVLAGSFLQVTATGTVKADALTGSRVIVAQALEAGAANELIEAVLFKPLVI